MDPHTYQGALYQYLHLRGPQLQLRPPQLRCLRPRPIRSPTSPSTITGRAVGRLSMARCTTSRLGSTYIQAALKRFSVCVALTAPQPLMASMVAKPAPPPSS